MREENSNFLEPLFLGAAAENGDLFESLLLEFVRDHAFWRRNFHPEDEPPIPASARNRDDFLEFIARTRSELYRLSSELKRAVPFFHPRYVGHMSSDLLLPGLVAKIVTTLYNPNNVSEEAAPITLEKELEVGLQLARMVGYNTEESSAPVAWGHLTSGGTVANYEALWNFRSVKFYAIALAEAARSLGFDPKAAGPSSKRLSEFSKWELMNLSFEETIALRRMVAREIEEHGDKRDFRAMVKAVRAERIETLGTAGFFLKHRDLRPPKVLVPASAHYSWEKGMKVLGFGTANLVKVGVDDHMRMDPGHLADCLERELGSGSPVLAVIGVLGTTEFGTVDPMHEILKLRDEWTGRGCHFGVHADAAWGGYLASIFRRPDGGFRDRDELRGEFRYFPSELVYESFAALGRCDSITIDPHKLGYVPYAAGAFLCRNRDVVDFLTQRAAYVFDLGDSDEPVAPGDKLRNLGQYILEGSKSGAAAAAVYVTHRVLPLDSEGFGRLLSRTVHTSEDFFDQAQKAAERLGDRVRIVVPFEPDTNVICLGLNPAGNRDLAHMNRFARTVFAAMKVDAAQPLQVKSFIGSYTSLLKENAPREQALRILEALGIDPATYRALPEDEEREADHIFLLRHTLMNPWLSKKQDGASYIDRYWTYLAELLDATLAAEKRL